MSNTFSFLWHDYETWGAKPRVDRPSQFAAIRTDYDLNEVDEPVMLYCKTGDDFLPHPQAVLITGISPQEAHQKGVCEADFFRRIHAEMSRANTCSVGYNSLRFDDEVTRFGFYRNFFDPYAREWQNSNSRWDIIDLARMAHALRPEGINWPVDDDGHVTFKLERLTAENGIEHQGAHDALVDVRATIAFAKLIKQKQPKLFDFYFSLRKKHEVSQHLDLTKQAVVLHVSGMYPIEYGRLAPVMPLIQHPINSNEVVVFDLRQDPQLLLSHDVDSLKANLYTKQDDREAANLGERVALKSIHINKSPALAPVSVLSDDLAEKWSIDWTLINKHRELLLNNPQIKALLQKFYQQPSDFEAPDADQALYNGFISNSDRQLCDKIITSSPEQLIRWQPDFNDERLKTLYFRYLARNWLVDLDEAQQQRWRQFCQARIVDGEFGNDFTLNDFKHVMEKLAAEPLTEEQQQLLKKLLAWIGE